MKFPLETKATLHKHGGTVTRITGIGHEVAKPKEGRSQDVWHFIGDVTWNDGGKSVGLQIAPWALCYETDRSEVDALMTAMNQHLHLHGTWCDEKSKHEGWYATKRK